MNTPLNSNFIYRYCGRVFTAEEIEDIRCLISSNPTLTRASLSRQVCNRMGWVRPNGRKKEMSCRVAMLRMHKDRLISLPPPTQGNGNGRNYPPITHASDPQEPITAPAGSLGQLLFLPVATSQDSKLWNELIHRYHYLGYKPLPGAQMRYMVRNTERLLAILGFGAATWKTAPRDSFIGWTPAQRQQNLHLIVNNARFLILPWIASPNLASRILSGIAKQLPDDWTRRYGYTPVLLETFVEQERFTGACYRAANWIHAGQTRGRGKLDRYYQCILPIKDIYLYPLHKRFRQILCT